MSCRRVVCFRGSPVRFIRMKLEAERVENVLTRKDLKANRSRKSSITLQSVLKNIFFKNS
jgi:hypothetical protein